MYPCLKRIAQDCQHRLHQWDEIQLCEGQAEHTLYIVIQNNLCKCLFLMQPKLYVELCEELMMEETFSVKGELAEKREKGGKHS